MPHKYEEVKLIFNNKTKAKDRPFAGSPEDAYSILRQAWDMQQINMVEESKLLLLDRKMRLMSICSLSKGGYSEVIVDARLIFAIAFKRRADSIILSHNHPSGDVTPSRTDCVLTKNIHHIGQLLNMPLKDHLIISNEGYFSMNNKGFMEYNHG